MDGRMRLHSRAISLLAAVCALGCGGAVSAEVASLVAEPAVIRLEAGAQASFLITGRHTDGSESDATAAVQLTGADPAIAVIEAEGVHGFVND